MKKLPYGISNYEELITENYYYVDKTKNIEKLEDLAEKRILFLRPRKFGKTLFTSMISYYYDINAKNKFEKLFKNTYIGKNPTPLKNSYCILKFNFSGIDTTTAQTTVEGFKEIAKISIQGFIADYNIDFYVNDNQTAEDMLNSLLESFRVQRRGQKIYVIIDEYDHFANELLGFHTEDFKNLVSKNGKVRKWYEILKKGTETVVDRIFITGVAPITLDSLTSGFNIGKDITQDFRFNEMMGFTKEELANIMKSEQIEEKEQEKILPIMKQSYDGYKFSIDGKEKIYNSNMCSYFLNEYKAIGDVPRQLIDVNIASDYSKLGKMLDLCQGEKREEILEKTVAGEGIVSDITEKFNPAIEFTEKDMISMLFYLGYLTIAGEEFERPELKIPNQVMKNIYSDYFIEFINKIIGTEIQGDYNEIEKEIALEGKISKTVGLLHEYLEGLSNRDFQKFDEKYVKLIFYCIVKNLKVYLVKSEMEVNRKYPDLLIVPKNVEKGYNAIMIEFKYLKKGEKNKLEEKQKEAKKQIEEYSDFEEIKSIPKLKKYTVIAVNDEIFVEEII
mgnify:CR=1 FL=1